MSPRSRAPVKTYHVTRHGGISQRTLFTLGAVGVIVSLFLLRLIPETGRLQSQTSLSANPSEALSSALVPGAVDFELSLVRRIQRQRSVTVTIHVALYDRRGKGVTKAYADGSHPQKNLYWGALFGMETHFANAAGWRRAYTDNGDGINILRRVVFHRRVQPTPGWQARGVNNGFDLYVLANAWPSSRIVEAMEQPLRDAICGRVVTLPVDGRELHFGGGSMIVGYVGQNHMLDEYWDPFALLDHCRASHQVGVFYACPRSAVVLHQPVIQHGLYPVLFMRATITPEAYLIDGMLKALISGELGDGFLRQAAREYARYQKSASFNLSKSMFIR